MSDVLATIHRAQAAQRAYYQRTHIQLALDKEEPMPEQNISEAASAAVEEPSYDLTIRIYWGSDPDLWDNGPSEYRFRTLAEHDAFLYGVNEAEGWLDYHYAEQHEEYVEDSA